MMMPAALLVAAQQCAPHVAPETMMAIVRTESSFNPWAIGVVHGHLLRQPAGLAEAVATVRTLDAAGWNFSAGLAQVNRSNWARLGLDARTVFDPCRNLAAGAIILRECLGRATSRHDHPPARDALQAALSCYASGGFTAGFRTGYVQQVLAAASQPLPPVPAIDASAPAIPVVADLSERNLDTTGRAPGTPGSLPAGSDTGRSGGKRWSSPHPDSVPDSAVVF